MKSDVQLLCGGKEGGSAGFSVVTSRLTHHLRDPKCAPCDWLEEWLHCGLFLGPKLPFQNVVYLVEEICPF